MHWRLRPACGALSSAQLVSAGELLHEAPNIPALQVGGPSQLCLALEDDGVGISYEGLDSCMMLNPGPARDCAGAIGKFGAQDPCSSVCKRPLSAWRTADCHVSASW